MAIDNKNFNDECYKVLKKVPKGKITTYKAIAEKLGSLGFSPKAYRAVGNAMNKNPDVPATPCHRVVCSDGGLGGYAYGIDRKKKMLSKEGIEFDGEKVKDLATVLYRFH